MLFICFVNFLYSSRARCLLVQVRSLAPVQVCVEDISFQIRHPPLKVKWFTPNLRRGLFSFFPGGAFGGKETRHCFLTNSVAVAAAK